MEGLATLLVGKEKPKPEKKLDEREAVASELILGIQERKPELVVKAFEALFQLCELEPHEEGDKRSLEEPMRGGYLDESGL